MIRAFGPFLVYEIDMKILAKDVIVVPDSETLQVLYVDDIFVGTLDDYPGEEFDLITDGNLYVKDIVIA